MYSCPCCETGKDGTSKHSGKVTVMVDKYTPSHTVRSCDNHKDNYLRSKLWKIKK